jgi:nitrilase
MGAAAQENRIYLAIGVIERDGGTLYCTVLFFAPDGSIMGKHCKLMPTALERFIWGFGDSSTMPVFSTPLGRIGAVICWENYMPLLRTYMYLTRRDWPEDYDAVQGNDPSTVLMKGGSCIVGPMGQVLADPDFSGEAILTADIDLDEIARGKYDLDVVGHYAWPDVFQLHVNTRPARPVVAHFGSQTDPFIRDG